MSDLIRVYADENFEPGKIGPAITTVGTFDGVHLGHRRILERLAQGDGQNRIRTVVTFEPHPQNVMRHRPGLVPIITSTAEKVALLHSYGVERVFILRFTKELAKVSADEFLTEILLKRLGSTKLVIGYNHYFGRHRQGDREFLEKVKNRYGFELEVVGPHDCAGETVSSTKIRAAVRSGDVEKAREFLGRPYALVGQVVPGAGRGKTLQFPTANLKPIHPEKLIPGNGVYAVAVRINDQVHPGMLSIGTRPTFGESETVVEVHLIRFEGDLYGRNVHLLFFKRIRDEKLFDKVDDLISQMRLDQVESLRVLQAERSFESHLVNQDPSRTKQQDR